MCKEHLTRDDIATFYNIDVFRTTYEASLVVLKRVVPFIPDNESNLRDQLAQSVRDIPCTIASEVEGGLFKDGRFIISMAPTYIGEVMVLLGYCRDLHQRHINKALCEELLAMYERARQEIRGPGEDMGEGVKHATVLG